MLDMHTTEHGYIEIQPPLLVKDHVMFGTAQLPKFADDQFMASRTRTREELLHEALDLVTEPDKERYVQGEITLQQLVDTVIDRAPAKEDFWLIPTAEVPLTNLVREAITPEAELPLRFTALTPCFRAEAGAAGRDTRGMLRQHQFDKVELVSITTPETSIEELERMLACAEAVMKRLDLHYRVMTLVHRRYGLCLAEDLRHRGLASGAGNLSRDLFLLGLRRLPGAAHECALPSGVERRKARSAAPRAYAQRLGRRGRARPHRRHGELPERGWLDRGALGAACRIWAA